MSNGVCNPSQGRENLKNVSKCHFLNLNGWIVKRACVSHAVKPWHLFDSNFKRIPLIYWCGHFLFPRAPLFVSPVPCFEVTELRLRLPGIVKSASNRGTCSLAPPVVSPDSALLFSHFTFYCPRSQTVTHPFLGRGWGENSKIYDLLHIFKASIWPEHLMFSYRFQRLQF